MLRFPADVIERLRPAVEHRRVVVTGGAGFIGSHLVDALVSLGARVAIIDDLSNGDAAYAADLVELDPQRVAFVHGSILDRAALDDAFDALRGPLGVGRGEPTGGQPVVFHLAAVGSVPLSIERPARSWDVNATGTMRVLEALRAAGGGRCVFSSSSSIYGDRGAQSGEPCEESHPPAPMSPYAASKLAAEQVLAAWSRSYAMEGVALRYFNVFGPRQRADSAYAAVIPAFASAMLGGHRPTIFGDGEQTRDFTFVANVVLANLLAATVPAPPAGSVVNVGTGQATSLNELARMMAQAVGGEAEQLRPVHEAPRVGEVRHSRARIDRAGELLGYRPLVTLAQGLEDTIAWHRRGAGAPVRRD